MDKAGTFVGGWSMKTLGNGICIPERGDREDAAQMVISADLEIIGKWMIETEKKLKELSEGQKGGTG